jgi:hypothetical protein
MPFKNEEDRKAYMKKYEEIRREERRKQKRENWLKNHEHNLAVLAKRNKKKGFQKRKPGGTHLKNRPRVSKVRRWTIIEDRIYFNREIGFTLEEMREVMKAFREGLQG